MWVEVNSYWAVWAALWGSGRRQEAMNLASYAAHYVVYRELRRAKEPL